MGAHSSESVFIIPVKLLMVVYENPIKFSSQSVLSPTPMVKTTDRLISATTTATIAAGKWELSSSMMLLSSPVSTAGTMIAVSTAIGIKSLASLKVDGNLRGAIPDSMMNRIKKVNNPVMIMMAQIIKSLSDDLCVGATSQPEPHQSLRSKAHCSRVVLVQLEQAHLQLHKLAGQAVFVS